MASEDEKQTSSNSGASSIAQNDERDQEKSDGITLPSHVAGSGSLDRLVDTARDYARQATSENTNKAYAKDWAHFSSWCRRRGANALPPSPELIGLYIANCAAPDTEAPALSVSTIERRLSGLAWHYQRRGFILDRKNRHIATVLAGIKRKHARPPVQKEAILRDDILAMVAALPYDLRGLRDRAILLIGYAGGLRRSEIVSLDVSKDDTPDSGGWIKIMDEGALLTLNAKTGWREVEIGRGSSDQTCPVHTLEQWLHFAKIDFGPVFVRTSRDGTKALEARLSDKHVARLIKHTVLDAGIRSELPEKDRLALFSGHSLRAGLASSAEVDERYVQKHLGHASAEMTRKYQRRRDRFRVNLTKAAGL
ncbi:tyrosine-type recombinase/integrase [Sulfitobacter sp. M57]|uniref:tyrosine-type recombinase/integrase n=1 Tax=unclassified Sulfitobacter TaxID=196795 RepID=UPI0023E26DA6|nr:MULTISPECIES: tyrosine-type recombinase/integrase [unclassified Sulfitobacter]MDF3416693.1 tyrosine-type recombinase/integrase [Sulfitobacter sp. KE5]MDF3424174.1 tyrosine-type recombinase/integrase [Sulfitobacter sp. KE43]MDF3435264.1 tyrosine-type recombinase/integrase [Sulfitobacter sp. KE42]MDF3460878.1 tyrosine-type recombinase/integrase [Sulfitobacter sp. S74]MDF3464776.1 tyrosine-type recombinase/integrase [Sulfitobacter sp. Ks18]